MSERLCSLSTSIHVCNSGFLLQVSRLAKPFEWDGREKVFAPELLQRIEIKLDSMGGTEGADCCRLTVYRRPSDGQYSVVVSFGQDGEYSEKQSPPYVVYCAFYCLS